MEISDASLLDEGVSEVTPLFRYGSGPFTSVVRKGAGPTPPGSNSFFPLLPDFLAGMKSGPAYVPPGKFLTIRRNQADTVNYVVVGFAEVLR
jgi:hypothetical protein